MRMADVSSLKFLKFIQTNINIVVVDLTNLKASSKASLVEVLPEILKMTH